MLAALNFLEQYDKDGNKMLDHTVTGDETWVLYVTPKTKCQSLEWHHPWYPSRPKGLRSYFLHARRWSQCFGTTMEAFMIIHGSLMICDFMTWEEINVETYCGTLMKLWCAIQNLQHRLLFSGVVLLIDIAHPQTSRCTRELLAEFKWEVFEHPPYSLYLAPRDFHLFFSKLKEVLSGVHLDSDNEVQTTVLDWLNGLAAEFYKGVQILISYYSKCLIWWLCTKITY